MAFFETLLNSYEKNIATLSLKLDGTVIDVNNYYLEIISESAEKILGKNITELDATLHEKGITELQNSS